MHDRVASHHGLVQALSPRLLDKGDAIHVDAPKDKTIECHGFQSCDLRAHVKVVGRVSHIIGGIDNFQSQFFADPRQHHGPQGATHCVL